MKILNYLSQNIVLLIISSFIVSCEEVIEIDLNSSNPVLVAEGKILQDSVSYIRLSYTSDYFSADTSEIVANAKIILSDSEGNTEQLIHTENGFYLGSTIKGKPGVTYAITIENANEVYTAETSLILPVEIYEATFTEKEFNRPGPGHGSESGKKNYSLELKFSDNPDEENFYMVKYWNNGEYINDDYTLVPDLLAKNDTITSNSRRTNFEEGSYRVEVISLDESTYNYYNQLNDLSGGGVKNSSTPYNPISNFGSEVMGYFTAMSFNSMEGKVED